ncbi:MAG: molecular chaperone HtpG [Sphingobacteriales bacterium]|nr:MAG: molecular chaperone HtpG [Sphingobacteriales bacterium]
MQKGTISVQTENIFPIIKKFLYSEQEIFLRELVSNAVDATQKLKTLSSKGEAEGELGDLTIEVIANQDAGTITIRDKGIGMTYDEVERYITQIAFSSAKEFLSKHQDANAIIGNFGLGFYSAFMVSDKVEIITKSYQKDSPAVHWICEGSTEYEIDETTDKTTRGTDIVLHLGKEHAEYLQNDRIQSMLAKYCRFLPVEIKFGTRTEYLPKATTGEDVEDAETQTEEVVVDNIINDPNPIWTKKPADITPEQYKSFYHSLYPVAEDPLFWIHLNVDYPFKLTGILYFPKVVNNYEIRKDRIHLYCNQVFVTDHVENIVPDYLMLLHGVIDSPDIPLNVSRSYLQTDPEVRSINKYISKKVSEKLEEMFKNNRPEFEQKWRDIGVLIKYGMLSDEKFNERAQKYCLFENIDGQFFTPEEYKEKVKTLQTDKHNKIVCLYSNGTGEQHSYEETAKAAGYDVLKFDTLLDPHFIGHLESKQTDLTFKRVDADTLGHLIEKEETPGSVLTSEQEEQLKEMFNKVVDANSAMIMLRPMSPTDAPVLVTRPEFIRRWKDMSNISGGKQDNMFGDMYNLVLNTNHPALVSLLSNTQDEEHQKHLVQQLYDLALLQQNMLKGAELTRFINRSISLLQQENGK